MAKKVLLIISIIVLFFSCSEKQQPPVAIGKIDIAVDNTIIVADTVTYNLELINEEPDDEIIAGFFKNLKRETLISCITNMVVSGKIEAYDYFTNQIIDADKLKKDIKKGIFRLDDFAQMQFMEEWSFDTVNVVFTKNVRSIVFGYRITDDLNHIKGYKPIFKIYLNHNNHVVRK